MYHYSHFPIGVCIFKKAFAAQADYPDPARSVLHFKIVITTRALIVDNIISNYFA
jgi:hypothetical protein